MMMFFNEVANKRRYLSTSCTSISLIRSLCHRHANHIKDRATLSNTFKFFNTFNTFHTLPLHKKHCNVPLLHISRNNWVESRVGRAVPSFKVMSALHPLWVCQAELSGWWVVCYARSQSGGQFPGFLVPGLDCCPWTLFPTHVLVGSRQVVHTGKWMSGAQVLPRCPGVPAGTRSCLGLHYQKYISWFLEPFLTCISEPRL